MAKSDRDSGPSGPGSGDPAGARLLLLAVIVLWGANWPVMKLGLASIPPLWFAAARVALGAAILFVILAATRRLRLPPRHDLSVFASVTLFQMVLFLALVNLALLSVEAGRAAVLAYTTPVWVTPGAVWLLGERVTRRKVLGVALGLLGVVVLFGPGSIDWGDPGQVRGNALLLLAALGWAVAILHVRAHRWASTPLVLAPWQMLAAAAILAGLAAALEADATVRWSPELLLILAYNGSLATGFCFWAAITVSRRLPAISTSLGFLGVPVAGLVASALVLGEPLTPELLGGLALIATGMALVILAPAAKRS